MNNTTIVAAILFAAATSTMGDAAAERIQANSKESGKAFSACGKTGGGAQWSQTKDNPTYGCIDKNGHGLVCGGGTAEQQSTCDTFRAVPPRLPTRDEVFFADHPADLRMQEEKASAP